jgi:hypothetical protein
MEVFIAEGEHAAERSFLHKGWASATKETAESRRWAGLEKNVERKGGGDYR